LAGILLRESAPRRFRLNLRVLGAYITVFVLHGLWDGIPSVIGMFTSSTRAVFIGEGIVGAIGVGLLIILWFKAKKQGRERLARG